MELARKETEEITAQLRFKVAQKCPNRKLEMNNLKVGEPVFVYRQRSKRWERPYKLVGQNRKAVLVKSLKGK